MKRDVQKAIEESNRMSRLFWKADKQFRLALEETKEQIKLAKNQILSSKRQLKKLKIGKTPFNSKNQA
jgi:hypothetical protein